MNAVPFRNYTYEVGTWECYSGFAFQLTLHCTFVCLFVSFFPCMEPKTLLLTDLVGSILSRYLFFGKNIV